VVNHEIDPPVMSKAVANLYIGQEGVFRHSTEQTNDEISEFKKINIFTWLSSVTKSASDDDVSWLTMILYLKSHGRH